MPWQTVQIIDLLLLEALISTKIISCTRWKINVSIKRKVNLNFFVSALISFVPLIQAKNGYWRCLEKDCSAKGCLEGNLFRLHSRFRHSNHQLHEERAAAMDLMTGMKMKAIKTFDTMEKVFAEGIKE